MLVIGEFQCMWNACGLDNCDDFLIKETAALGWITTTSKTFFCGKPSSRHPAKHEKQTCI